MRRPQAWSKHFEICSQHIITTSGTRRKHRNEPDFTWTLECWLVKRRRRSKLVSWLVKYGEIVNLVLGWVARWGLSTQLLREIVVRGNPWVVSLFVKEELLFVFSCISYDLILHPVKQILLYLNPFMRSKRCMCFIGCLPWLPVLLIVLVPEDPFSILRRGCDSVAVVALGSSQPYQFGDESKPKWCGCTLHTL